MGPKGEGEGKGRVAEGPQPCTVEAMCEANWPTQGGQPKQKQASTGEGHLWSRGSLLEGGHDRGHRQCHCVLQSRYG